jgi:hypothetical protein
MYMTTANSALGRFTLWESIALTKPLEESLSLCGQHLKNPLKLAQFLNIFPPTHPHIQIPEQERLENAKHLIRQQDSREISITSDISHIDSGNTS